MLNYILVVDDDESILEVVQIVLESGGYCVQTSLSGEPLRSLDTNLPNLILLDVLLAGEDGRELCQLLKSGAKTKYIPIIMLSAHSQTSQLADLSGANTYLEKPFDVDELLTTVRKYMDVVEAN